MVTRRGMRLEVDQPTDWQKRNKGWLAQHPLVVALVGAAIFAGPGALLGSSGDSSSGLVIGSVLGAAMGAGIGWAFSVENREHVSTKTKIAAYAVCGLCLLLLAIIKTV